MADDEMRLTKINESIEQSEKSSLNLGKLDSALELHQKRVEIEGIQNLIAEFPETLIKVPDNAEEMYQTKNSEKGNLTKKLVESYEDIKSLEQDRSSLKLPSKMPSTATVEQWIVRAKDIKELFKSIENNHSELEKNTEQLKDFQHKIWLTKPEDWSSRISNINQIEKLVNDIKVIKLQLDTIIIEHPDIDKSALVKRRDLLQSKERLLSRWLSTGVKPFTIKSERSNLWVVGVVLLIAGLLCILSFSSPLLGGIAMLCAGFFLSVLRPSSGEDSSSASGPFKSEVQEQFEEKFGKSVQKWTEMVVTDHIAKCRQEIIEIQRSLDRFKTIEIQKQKRQKVSKSLDEKEAKLKNHLTEFENTR